MRQRTKFRIEDGRKSTTRAILYCRVSTARQALDGVSLEDQETKLIAEANRRGIEDYTIIVERGASGKSLKRTEFQKAMSLLASGERNLLLVTKLDRLSRSTADVLHLATASQKENWNIVILDGTVRFDTTTPNGRLMLTMMSALAEFEREQIALRVNEAMSFKRERGDDGLISPALETDIINRYKSGTSMDKVAKALNAEGVETAKGGKWYASTIKRVIDRA